VVIILGNRLILLQLADDMGQQFRNIGSKKISVVGLGYVGLPTALAMYDKGHNINGIDISEKVITMISEGKNPIIDATSVLIIPVNSDLWKVSMDFKGIRDSDFVIVTVPTPTNEDMSPNFGYVESAMNSVLKNINPKMRTTIILESTVSPGTTRRIVTKAAKLLNLNLGQDFYVAYSPERVSPGEVGKSVTEVARLVGCDDKENGEEISKLYSSITSGGCKYVGTIEIAEAAKMIENVQRDLDIAFVNELALILPEMGLDVEAVLDAASSKWSFHRHTPGIGVGGHCIPVDPYYYIDASNKLGVPSLLGPIARKINDSMPHISSKYIIRDIGNTKNSKVLILGYSYKPEVGDTRMTPVLELASDLHKAGIEIFIWDPYVKADDFPDWIVNIEDPYKIEGLDYVILATGHLKCLHLNWKKLLDNCQSNKIYDGRRLLNKISLEEIGWNYSGVGYPK
jgi:UDP-N-acetyl-D-glucosamine/UDP-N-acetyl-D-galactosamine dehydrogenase